MNHLMIYLLNGKSKHLKAVYPPLPEGLTLQFERRAMPMYVTYSALIQIGIFIVALIGLIYEIFKGKK